MPLTPTTFGDAESFRLAAADFLASRIRDAIAEGGRCVIGLSGGSTPGPVYSALGGAGDIDWSKVWVFLTDDRRIAADDPRSNQFLLRSTLLALAPVPESQLIFPDPALPHEECAARYDEEIGALLRKSPADVVTLGMGDDGHIASLFPPLPDLAFGPVHAIATTTDRFDVRERISVTLPVLTEARTALLLLKGEGKRRTLEETATDAENARRWPLKAVADAGRLRVFWAP